MNKKYVYVAFVGIFLLAGCSSKEKDLAECKSNAVYDSMNTTDTSVDRCMEKKGYSKEGEDYHRGLLRTLFGH